MLTSWVFAQWDTRNKFNPLFFSLYILMCSGKTCDMIIAQAGNRQFVKYKKNYYL